MDYFWAVGLQSFGPFLDNANHQDFHARSADLAITMSAVKGKNFVQFWLAFLAICSNACTASAQQICQLAFTVSW
jgi:hypothetical protein